MLPRSLQACTVWAGCTRTPAPGTQDPKCTSRLERCHRPSYYCTQTQSEVRRAAQPAHGTGGQVGHEVGSLARLPLRSGNTDSGFIFKPLPYPGNVVGAVHGQREKGGKALGGKARKGAKR